MHGQFVWYELTTPDVDASKKFYPRFTGWGTQAFDADYTMFTHGGIPVAGIFRLTDEMKAQGIPPNWMPYIESRDVDATVAKARSLGATITAGPGDIPGTGRFAVIQDPQGAVFGVYKSVRESGAWDGTAVVGRPSWHELMTTDHRKASQFYNALFGWQKMSEMDMGGGQMYELFGSNGAMYGGMYSMNDDWKAMHPFWLVYIHVKDVAKAVDIATKAGATIHRPQMDIPGGSIAILGDPQGAGFAVHQTTAQPAAEPVREKVAKTVAAVSRKVVAGAKTLATKAKKAVAKARKKTARKPIRKAAKKPARKPARPARPSKAAKTRTAAKRKRQTRKAPARKTATRSRSRAGARKKK